MRLLACEKKVRVTIRILWAFLINKLSTPTYLRLSAVTTIRCGDCMVNLALSGELKKDTKAVQRASTDAKRRIFTR